MAIKELIYLGTSPDSGTGDSARRGGEKINSLFADVYANLGDNPVGNDPNGPFYGYRRPIREYEQVVGEIHGAGRFVPVEFDSELDPDSGDVGPVRWDSEYGFGIDTGWMEPDDPDSELSHPRLETSNTGTAPDIYRHRSWYFLSRGEAATLDLSELFEGHDVHIVLPLATAGDLVTIRDSLGSWGGQIINVWTTPYEFRTKAQILEFLNAHKIDSDQLNSRAVSIRQPDGEVKVCTYKSMRSPHSDFDSETRLRVNFSPDSDRTRSQVRFTSAENAEITFSYLGPQSGWVYSQTSLIASATDVLAKQDFFNSGDWSQLGSNIVGSGGEISVEQGYYIIPLYSGIDLENATSTPIAKIFRRSDGTTLENLRSALVTAAENRSFNEFETDPTEITLRNRYLWAIGRNLSTAADGTIDTTRTINGVNGFQDTQNNNFYTEVQVRSIVDTNGNIILVSREPFTGFAQIYIPTT